MKFLIKINALNAQLVFKTCTAHVKLLPVQKAISLFIMKIWLTNVKNVKLDGDLILHSFLESLVFKIQ